MIAYATSAVAERHGPKAGALAPAVAFLQPRDMVLQRCGGHACPAQGCGSRDDDRVLDRLADGAQAVTGIPSSVHETLAAPGQRLGASTRAALESRLGHDFADVRVHTDPKAESSAREVGALAYTVGSHIVFSEGRYRPGTAAGDRLLAHELAHVLQQRSGSVGRQLASLRCGALDDPAEAAAERLAAAVAGPIHPEPGPRPVTAPRAYSGLGEPRVIRRIQKKPRVSSAGDAYEIEADRVAAWFIDDQLRAAAPAAGEDRPTRSQPSPPVSDLGRPLDSRLGEELGRRVGFDFSHVRVYTDQVANAFSDALGARAFTHGSDIFFGRGEYDPGSTTGRSLLAHELTHVAQQTGAGQGPLPKLIQRTTIGDVLDEFFSPFSAETLWVMGPWDLYTLIVRRWKPVIEAVDKAKANLAANCTTWDTSHRTDPSWTPGKTKPPVTDPNAFSVGVPSPPGTDPKTCARAFVVYVTTKLSTSPTIQTWELYTCSIGSFSIHVTVDSIDCAAKTARLNIWMFNGMDRTSFGRYASHPAFALSGMERQFMWWNWTESHTWGPPGPGGTSPWGGGGRW